MDTVGDSMQGPGKHGQREHCVCPDSPFARGVDPSWRSGTPAHIVAISLEDGQPVTALAGQVLQVTASEAEAKT